MKCVCVCVYFDVHAVALPDLGDLFMANNTNSRLVSSLQGPMVCGAAADRPTRGTRRWSWRRSSTQTTT